MAWKITALFCPVTVPDYIYNIKYLQEIKDGQVENKQAELITERIIDS
jgi:hypothetical protein